MYQLFLLLHVILAIVLIVLVLIQHGKGANIGAAFGSGASGTVFGSQGSGSFLMKLTIALGAGFFATSLTLGYIASYNNKMAKSVALPVKSSTQVQAPAVPQPVKSQSDPTKK